VNKECLIDNLADESLIAQRQVWAGIQSFGGVKDVEITKKMILNVRSARSYYVTALEEKKKEAQKQESIDQEKKRAKRKIEELQNKKIRIMEETRNIIDTLDQEIQSVKK